MAEPIEIKSGPPNGVGVSSDASEALALHMMNTSVHAQVNAILQMNMPATGVMNLLIEHVATLLSLVEPAPLRASILDEIRRNLPAVLERHVAARRTTAGGIFMPAPGERVQ